MKKSHIDVEAARSVLRKNDRAGHTVPTDGLYPFQWNWDSAITALGWFTFDEARAWQEAETMFTGQWQNGMLPHILFHGDAGSYFPSPKVWDSRTNPPSSTITQPPVWATALRIMYDTANDTGVAREKVASLLPAVVRWHLWFYRERDPDGTGLVVTYHPWETGMDNSPAWDVPLAAVPEVDWDYQRRDLGMIDAEQRPKKAEYDRYLYLVDFYKDNNFDAQTLYRECPYRVVDICMVSVLQRAGLDLLYLCEKSGQTEGVAELRQALSRTQDAVDSLWSDERRCFLNRDLVSGELLDEVTSATVLPLLGKLASERQAAAMFEMLDEWLDATEIGLSSTHPSSAQYESQRYWRGPVWIHVNWLVALGAELYGRDDIAQRLREDARRCISSAGFREYFDSDTGLGCGGDRFSWTAAVTLFWLADNAG